MPQAKFFGLVHRPLKFATDLVGWDLLDHNGALPTTPVVGSDLLPVGGLYDTQHFWREEFKEIQYFNVIALMTAGRHPPKAAAYLPPNISVDPPPLTCPMGWYLEKLPSLYPLLPCQPTALRADH